MQIPALPPQRHGLWGHQALRSGLNHMDSTVPPTHLPPAPTPPWQAQGPPVSWLVALLTPVLTIPWSGAGAAEMRTRQVTRPALGLP